MGWNDRLINNPYPPYEDYTEEDRYTAYQEYLEYCRQNAGISSQNVDPAELATNTQERSQPRTIVARLWSKIFGEEVSTNEQESNRNREHENADLPF